jgi:hypothetical protein|tara:strand:- start:78 stop:296 length:219 start_codon:yes stop_codon:yes gene_type:complete
MQVKKLMQVFFIKTKLTNMPRPKGSQNKITSEVKDKPQLLIDDLIASLDANKWTLISVLRIFKWPYNKLYQE